MGVDLFKAVLVHAPFGYAYHQLITDKNGNPSDMVSDRPYRKTMKREQALAEIADKAGTQFDPDIVKVFLKVMGNSTA